MKRLVEIGTLPNFQKTVQQDPQFLPYLRRHLFKLLGNCHVPEILPWLARNHRLELQIGHYQVARNHWIGRDYKNPVLFVQITATFLNLQFPIDFHFFHTLITLYDSLDVNIMLISFQTAIQWPCNPALLSEISR